MYMWNLLGITKYIVYKVYYILNKIEYLNTIGNETND